MNDDVNEVERLRARVAELENQPSAHGAGGTPARRTGHRSAWWAVSSAVLLTLACVLAPLSAVAVWANAQISDTDAYVQTVAPLADDPAVQSAVADKVTVLIFDNLDIEQITTDALNTLAQQPNVPPRAAALLPGLAVPITDGVKSFTRDQVGAFVASPQFAQIWEEVNRAAHTQVDKLLSGNEGGAVSAQGDTITLNLGPIVAQVKDRLVAQGFSLAQNIPPVDQSFVLVQSDAITSAQSFYQLLNNLGFWLPVIVVVLFVGGVMLARDRRRALLKGALGLTGAMIVLGVLLALARSWYVGATPADILTENAAGSVFDTLVRFLRTALRATAVLGLVLALAAFLTGPASGAVRTRSAFEGGIGGLRAGAQEAGWSTGRFGVWVYAHRTALRVGVLLLAGLALMFWTRPSGMVVVGVAIAAVVVLALLEFLAAPPRPTPATAGPVPAGPTLPRQRPPEPADQAEPAAPATTEGAPEPEHAPEQR